MLGWRPDTPVILSTLHHIRRRQRQSASARVQLVCMLRQILLLQRDVPRAAKFYSQSLGLKVNVLTDSWAELCCGSSVLALKAVEGYRLLALIWKRGNFASRLVSLFWQSCREALCSPGYSPFISFSTDDLQRCVTSMLDLGARMDGAVQYTPQGKVSTRD